MAAHHIIDARLQAPAPAFAQLYDAGGAPGSEKPLSLLELDAAILTRLTQGALDARAKAGAP